MTKPIFPDTLEETAKSLGVTVRSAPTPCNLWGVYDHPYRLITIKPGLAKIQYRSTLAHELGHAYYGHHGHHPRTERQADRWAAKRLLDYDTVLTAATENLEIRELSAALEVMPWVLKSFVSTLNEKQILKMQRLLKIRFEYFYHP